MREDNEFCEFVDANSARLLGMAWLLTQDRQASEDLVQQTLTALYVRWNSLSGDRLPYARRILLNSRTDSWRRKRRERVAESARLSVALNTQHQRDLPRQFDEVLTDRDTLAPLLRSLTKQQRQVVVLRYYLDLSELDVARDLGISPGAVKSVASKSLAKMRRQILNLDDRTEGRASIKLGTKGGENDARNY